MYVSVSFMWNVGSWVCCGCVGDNECNEWGGGESGYVEENELRWVGGNVPLFSALGSMGGGTGPFTIISAGPVSPVVEADSSQLTESWRGYVVVVLFMRCMNTLLEMVEMLTKDMMEVSYQLSMSPMLSKTRHLDTLPPML